MDDHTQTDDPHTELHPLFLATVMADAPWHEVTAQNLADDDDGARLLRAAAALASDLPVVNSLPLAQTPLRSMQWSEQYINDGSHVDEAAYDAMIQDETRTPLFAAAIARRLRGTTDMVVLDIGTGPKALLALMAARAGARKVFAIEANPEAAAHARATIAAAQDVREGIIEIIEGFSTDVTLPERADLLVAELVGSIASEEGLVQSVRDAQLRHLKRPSDPRSFIPRRVQTLCAPAAYLLADVLRPPYCDDVDFAASREGAPVRIGCRDAALQLLSSPRLLEDLDLTQPMPSARDAMLRKLEFELSGARMAAAEAVHTAGLAPALTALHKVPPTALMALIRQLGRSLAGIACWPRLILDDTLVIESRDDGDTEGGTTTDIADVESHWQTVLLLLSTPPRPVHAGDVLQLEYKATFGERVDEPIHFELGGAVVAHTLLTSAQDTELWQGVKGARRVDEGREEEEEDDDDEEVEYDLCRENLNDGDACQVIQQLLSQEAGGPSRLLLECNRLEAPRSHRSAALAQATRPEQQSPH